MIYAVIDTNVLVSAMLKSGSNPGIVIAECLSGNITPVLNEEILSEYNEVLRRKKFGFSESVVVRIIEGLKIRGMYADKKTADETMPDPKDIVFYEVTMSARDKEESYLVTGNIKHFPIKPFVITPKEMVEMLKKSY